MRLFLKAIFCSLFLHLIFVGLPLLAGYIRTLFYRPSGEGWSNMVVLDSKISVGFVFSPVFFLLSFAGTAIFCGLLLQYYPLLTGWLRKRMNP
ncbi:hypothetical protein V1498_13630 [Peribacillus sp. SCS-26]|uniref:hypothetical protein n=1 Tax=Paraperibacillus marinus TaxID=3115295 RepID=UPI003905D285